MFAGAGGGGGQNREEMGSGWLGSWSALMGWLLSGGEVVSSQSVCGCEGRRSGGGGEAGCGSADGEAVT